MTKTIARDGVGTALDIPALDNGAVIYMICEPHAKFLLLHFLHSPGRTGWHDTDDSWVVALCKGACIKPDPDETLDHEWGTCLFNTETGVWHWWQGRDNFEDALIDFEEKTGLIRKENEDDQEQGKEEEAEETERECS